MECYAVALLLLATSFSVSSYRPYQHQIPNGQKVVNPCTGGIWDGVGHLNHNGGSTRNKFGEAFAAAGHVWGNDLCKEDSDGDGKSNGEELGDPRCQWYYDQQPDGIPTGHPGFCVPHLGDHCTIPDAILHCS